VRSIFPWSRPDLCRWVQRTLVGFTLQLLPVHSTAPGYSSIGGDRYRGRGAAIANCFLPQTICRDAGHGLRLHAVQFRCLRPSATARIGAGVLRHLRQCLPSGNCTSFLPCALDVQAEDQRERRRLVTHEWPLQVCALGRRGSWWSEICHNWY